jgi:hypothetical protein
MSALITRDACLSDLAIDRSLSAELGPEAQRELESHVASCARCGLRYDLLVRQREAFLERAPSWDTFAKSARRSRSSWLPWVTGGALAAIALLSFAGQGWHASTSTAPTVRTKGSPSIGVYIKRGDKVLRGSSGDVVHPGDRIRFTYSNERDAQFALLHTDSSGAAVYFPLAGTTVLVPAGRDTALDFAIELDEHTGDERVFGIFCDAPIALEPVRAALQTGGTVPALRGCHVDSLTLQKRPR